MMHSRRQLLSTAAAACLVSILPFWTGRLAAAAGAVTPEQFGAKGDGVTNDSAAFAAMAAHVTAQGGGEVVLRRATYLVGRQVQAFRRGTSFAFEPAKIMEFVGCSRPLVIRGNGATIRAARGLRYGTFHPVTGAKTNNPMPYIAPGQIAAPYRWMILAQDCSGPVEIENLELDGNMAGLSIGGQYGDVGWQIPATGIHLVNNRGRERLTNIYSHHHAQDGIMIDGLDRSRGAAVRSLLDNVRCEYNGRQGCSLVGGRAYDFRNCRFNHTGKAGIATAPGAGVDIEAEAGKKVRDISFTGCEFSNNAGCGLVADSGDSEDARFAGCTFIGTTNWSAWPNKPRFRFDKCTFVGAFVHPRGDPDPARAVQFHDCTFRDDPSLSPTRRVYGGENPDRPIGDLPSNINVLFSRCRFLLTHQAVLPWSTNVIYSNCTLSQRSQTISYPRGTYVGRNILNGRSTLSGAVIRGELILNGTPVPTGTVP